MDAVDPVGSSSLYGMQVGEYSMSTREVHVLRAVISDPDQVQRRSVDSPVVWHGTSRRTYPLEDDNNRQSVGDANVADTEQRSVGAPGKGQVDIGDGLIGV